MQTHVEHIRILSLGHGKNGEKILVALVHVVMPQHFDADVTAGLVDTFSQSLGVGGLVVHDEDGFGFQRFFHKLGCCRRLVIISSTHTEHVGQPPVGYVLMGRGGVIIMISSSARASEAGIVEDEQ